MEQRFVIRQAKPGDEDLILTLIHQLADYEKMSDEVVNTPELLRQYLFEQKLICCLIGEEDGSPVGFALYFFNYSTFRGRPGLYLEDLFLLPEARGKGYGTMFFQQLAATAVEKKCGRMEWSCLKWNAPSIGFYQSLGAVAMEEWDVYRLTEEKFTAIAQTPMQPK